LGVDVGGLGVGVSQGVRVGSNGGVLVGAGVGVCVELQATRTNPRSDSKTNLFTMLFPLS
jgi:hypothetical protein